MPATAKAAARTRTRNRLRIEYSMIFSIMGLCVFQPGFCLGNRVFTLKNPVSKAETGLDWRCVYVGGGGERLTEAGPKRQRYPIASSSALLPPPVRFSVQRF